MPRTHNIATDPLIGISVIVGLALCAPAIAHGSEACTVGFDQNLQIIFDSAVNTFANRTTSTGKTLDYCPTPGPRTDTLSCWVYRQSCEPGKYVSVYPQNASHFHISFADPTINCIDDGEFGRRNGRGGKCVPAEWASEPRILQTHNGRTWIEIAYKDYATASYNVFDMASINIGGTTPIQLWYEKADGSVWGWDRLTAGNLDLGLTGVKALWIRSADVEQLKGITINSFVVRI